jgi:hypothetical protein
VSTAVAAVLWGSVSGGMGFVFHRKRASRAVALCIWVLVAACGYAGFRLGCGFHL